MSAGYAEPGGSLARLIALRAAERPDFGFLHVGLDGPWSIGTIASAAQALARRLRELGLQPGARAVVRLGNDERFVAALAAVWQRGASVIAMHPAAPADDVRRVVESMQGAVVVTAPEDRSVENLPVPVVRFDRLDRNDPTVTELDVPPVDDDEEALVLLTSGSTGAPKGVVLTHGNGWSNLRATVSAFRRDTNLAPIPDEVKPPNLVANPLSHTAGVVRLLFALYVGRSVVLLPKFAAVAAKAAIDHYGIDHLTINPSMLRMLLEDLPPDADLGKVRYASSGTAPLPATLRDAFEQRFGVPVLQAYGQTEAFGGVAIESVRDVLAGRRRPGSVGKALPGVELRIASSDGTNAPAGTEGEVLVRTRSATAGYVGDAAGSGRPIDDDGWLYTGDLGHLDQDDYLFITGRLKNIIICGGFNIVPEEVEAALIADDAVRDASVIGVPDERLGEVPVAAVEASDDGDAILTRLGDRLAPYKRPRCILVVDSLPRVPNGKVDVAAVRALVASQT